VLHVLFGADSFSRSEAFADLRRQLDGDGMLATNTSTFEAKSVTPAELFAACDAMPFLSAHRLIVVEGLLSSGEARPRRGRATRAKKADEAATWADLPDFTRRMPETTELVLLDGDVKAENALLGELRAAGGELRQFPALKPEQLPAWIEARVRQRGATIAPRAVRALAESVGPNLWQMQNEVEKLSLYAYGRPIESADVATLISVAQQATVFQLTDAVLAGQGAQALRLARLLLDGGTAAPMLITLLARQFRQLLLLRAMQRSRSPRAEMMRATEVRNDYVLGRLLAQSGRFSAGWLERGYERLLAADLAIKRGQQDEETAIELLVAEVAGLR
jgi:DNA polymerase III subunit delta